jgi:hypothetical protein
MVSFGSRVEWHECASDDPSEWSYADLDIFYSAGRCHHLACAHVVRDPSMRIAVLFETDDDELEEPGMWAPHHVFALSRDMYAHDVAGRRTIPDMVAQFDDGVGFMKPEIVVYETLDGFMNEVFDRRDSPLQSMARFEIDRAMRLIERRGHSLSRERKAYDDSEKMRLSSRP